MNINVTDEATDTAWPPTPAGNDDPDLIPTKSARIPLHKRETMRQFVKFCIVGVSSAAINFGLMNIMHYKFGVSLIASLTIAFLLSVFNGFFWNRKWTFAHARGRSAANQYTKFLAVNIVGYILNTSITVAIIAAFVVSQSHGTLDFGRLFIHVIEGKKGHYPRPVTNGALLGATGAVVFWNFFANRYWTFKH